MGKMDLLSGLLVIKQIAKLDGNRPYFCSLGTEPFCSRFPLHIYASRFL